MLTQEQYKEFQEKLRKKMQKGNERLGEAAFNALFDINADMAVFITGTEKDPYQDETNMNRFYEFITPKG